MQMPAFGKCKRTEKDESEPKVKTVGSEFFRVLGKVKKVGRK